MLLLFFTQHEKRVPLAPMRIPYKSRPSIFRLPDAACQCPRPMIQTGYLERGTTLAQITDLSRPTGRQLQQQSQ